MSAKVNIAVLCATGYSGLELTRLLVRHPRIDAPLLFRRTDNGEQRESSPATFPALASNGQSQVEAFSWTKLQQQHVELLFLATPHEVSRELVPEAIERGLRVVDLSGAWRLKQDEHRAVYGFKDADPSTAAQVTARAVYGLPELNADCIPAAALVANPGCYAPSWILA